jgi:hypothetical protein
LIARACGCRLFRDPDARLPLEVAGRLFFESARLADCPHFALLVGERFNLDGLGPLGELMRHSPSVGAALAQPVAAPATARPRRGPTAAASRALTPSVLGYSVYRHFTPGAEFIYDVAVTIGHRILLGLCGPDFAAPDGAVFLSSGPRGPRPTAACSARRCTSMPKSPAWSSRRPGWPAPSKAPIPARHRALTLALQQAQASGPLSLGGQVERVLHQLLLSGHGTAEGRGAAVWHQPAHLAAPARCGRQKLPGAGQSHPP